MDRGDFLKIVNIVIAGFGRVGRAFGRVVSDKRNFCRDRYGLDLVPKAALKSDGGILSDDRLPIEALLADAAGGLRESVLWKQGLRFADIKGSVEPGVMVECTPSDLKTGEPGLSHIISALENGWHVATASKGALVLKFRELKDLASERGVRLMASGAAAAALPTLDVGIRSLAGAEVLGIEGILNGTTNCILTKMEEGMTYAQALAEAQSRGIAEPDPTMDVDGWDTAAKLLIISNFVIGTVFRLDEVGISGIRDIAPHLVAKAAEAGKAVRLMGKCSKEDRAHPWKLEVGLALLDGDHPLFGVRGTTKGITFYTDTMGPVTVVGGRSDPVGTGAALLKDIINIYNL
jgi:homoserine dehydrogenase